jgi:hypothetical protein
LALISKLSKIQARKPIRDRTLPQWPREPIGKSSSRFRQTRCLQEGHLCQLTIQRTKLRKARKTNYKTVWWKTAWLNLTLRRLSSDNPMNSTNRVSLLKRTINKTFKTCCPRWDGIAIGTTRDNKNRKSKCWSQCLENLATVSWPRMISILHQPQRWSIWKSKSFKGPKK